jgi:hypothetical protein
MNTIYKKGAINRWLLASVALLAGGAGLFITSTAIAQTTCVTGSWTVANQPPNNCFPYPNGLFQKPLPNGGNGGPLIHLMANSDAIAQTALTKMAMEPAHQLMDL